MAAEAQAVARVEETTVKPWVIAAPRHGLRRGHRDGLRHSHARVHGQSISIFFNQSIPKIAFNGDVITSKGSKYYFKRTLMAVKDAFLRKWLNRGEKRFLAKIGPNFDFFQ